MEISFPYAAAKKGSTLGPIEVLCMLLHPNLNFQVKDAVWEVIIWHVIQCTVEEEGGRAGSGSGGGSGGGGGGGYFGKYGISCGNGIKIYFKGLSNRKI